MIKKPRSCLRQKVQQPPLDLFRPIFTDQQSGNSCIFCSVCRPLRLPPGQAAQRRKKIGAVHYGGAVHASAWNMTGPGKKP